MKRLLTIGVLAMVVPAAAQGAARDFRVNLEPGVASLREPQQASAWGLLGGLSVSLGLSELLALQLHADRKLFLRHRPRLSVMAWGLGVVYNFDILWVSPLCELGLAAVSLTFADGTGARPEYVPLLGVGFDLRVTGWVIAGAVFRYYPLLDTDFLTPAYGAINARIGVVFGGVD